MLNKIIRICILNYGIPSLIHPQFQNHVFIITVSHTLGQTKHLPMELSIWIIIHKQALVIALNSLEVQPKKMTREKKSYSAEKVVRPKQF